MYSQRLIYNQQYLREKCTHLQHLYHEGTLALTSSLAHKQLTYHIWVPIRNSSDPNVTLTVLTAYISHMLTTSQSLNRYWPYSQVDGYQHTKTVSAMWTISYNWIGLGGVTPDAALNWFLDWTSWTGFWTELVSRLIQHTLPAVSVTWAAAMLTMYSNNYTLLATKCKSTPLLTSCFYTKHSQRKHLAAIFSLISHTSLHTYSNYSMEYLSLVPRHECLWAGPGKEVRNIQPGYITSL